MQPKKILEPFESQSLDEETMMKENPPTGDDSNSPLSFCTAASKVADQIMDKKIDPHDEFFNLKNYGDVNMSRNAVDFVSEKYKQTIEQYEQKISMYHANAKDHVRWKFSDQGVIFEQDGQCKSTSRPVSKQKLIPDLHTSLVTAEELLAQ